MLEKQIVVANQLVNYLASDAQDSAREAVVFLHGWRSEAAVWKKAMADLESSFRVFALDLPGFGKSEKPKHTFDLADYSLVVRGFIEKVVIRSTSLPESTRAPLPSPGESNKVAVALVGHSFGGRVAIKLSSTEPELIKKLVLVDSAGFNFHNKNKREIFRFFSKIARPFFRLPGIKSLRPAVYKAIGAEDYVATPELKETFMKVINEDLTALLRFIRQQTLIVWGGKDEETPMLLGMLLKENIRHSDMVVFNDAGHYSFLDEPKKFAETVRHFLKG